MNTALLASGAPETVFTSRVVTDHFRGMLSYAYTLQTPRSITEEILCMFEEMYRPTDLYPGVIMITSKSDRAWKLMYLAKLPF